MPLTELQRSFLQLIAASGGSVASVAQADPKAKQAFDTAHAAAVAELDLLDGMPGVPQKDIDAFVKELNAQLGLASRGSFDEARQQVLALHKKIQQTAAALKNDPALKGYREQLAQADRLVAEVRTGMDQLKAFPVHAILNKEFEAALKRKTAAEASVGKQTPAQSAALMEAAVKGFAPVVARVNGTIAERGAWEAVAVPARGEVAILSAMPRGNPTNLARMLAAAEQLGERGDFVMARTALKGFDALAKAERESAAKLEKAMLAQFEKQGSYEERLAKATALMKAMMTLPGTRETRNRVDDAIKEARALARNSDFAAANERLKKIDDVKLESMQKASSKAMEKAGKDPEFAKLRQEAETEVARMAKLAVTSQADAAREDMLILFDRIASDPKDTTNMDSLRRSILRMRKTAEELEAQKKSAMDALRAVENQVRLIAQNAGEGAAAVFMLRARQFATALGQNRFREVADGAAELLTEATTAAKKAETVKAEWAKAAGEIKALQAECAKVVEPAAAKADAQAILVRLAEVQALATGATPDLEVALAGVQTQKTALAAAQKKAADFLALGKERTAANKRFAAKLADVDAALAKLDAALAKARAGEAAAEGGRASLGFAETRKELADGWEKTAASALTSAELAIDAAVQQADALIAAITAASSPEGLKQAVATQQRLEGVRRFEKAWPIAEAAIRALQTIDVGEGDLAYGLAQAARTLSATDPVAALKQLGEIEADANKRAVEAGKRREEDRGAAKALAQKVEQALAALQKKAASKLFEPLFADLRNQHEALVLATDSDNLDAIAEARASLRELNRKIADMESRMGASGPDMDHFKGVQAKLDAIKADLAKPELKERVPSQVTKLTESLAAALKTLPSKTPTEAMGQLRELQLALSEAQQASSLAKARRDAFEVHAKGVSARIKELDDQLAYTKALPGRLEALRKACRTEGGETRALDDLDKLDQEIRGALKDPAAAQTLDTQARAAALKKEQDRIVWAGKLKTFQAVDLPAAERAVAKGGDKTLIDEIQRMVKAAENLAKAGNHAEALSSLEMARARAAQAVQNPAGTTIGTRNELPKDVGIYKGAVSKLNAALAAFPAAVKAKAGEGLDGALAGKLGEMVKKLALVFPPGAFDAPVARLAAAETDADGRRAAREQGLATVRALQTQLQQHPGLLSLQKNPIDPAPIQTALSGLYYALNRLEGNLLRACK